MLAMLLGITGALVAGVFITDSFSSDSEEDTTDAQPKDKAQAGDENAPVQIIDVPDEEEPEEDPAITELTEERDIHFGEDESEIIHGLGGDDHIEGEGGDDRILGGKGDDALHGNDGDDVLVGGDGDDALFGHNDDDTISGDAGDDRLTGGGGNDTLDGGTGDDRLEGKGGDDHLTGGAGTDTFFGGTGSDVLNGRDGEDDFLNGGGGDDTLIGDAGDMLHGGAGADTFVLARDETDVPDDPAPTTISDYDGETDRIVVMLDPGSAPPVVELHPSETGTDLHLDGELAARIVDAIAMDPDEIEFVAPENLPAA